MKKLTPLKAIRLKCLDCSCDSIKEVNLCWDKKCPLYDFRHGKNPYNKRTFRPSDETIRKMQEARKNNVFNKGKIPNQADNEG